MRVWCEQPSQQCKIIYGSPSSPVHHSTHKANTHTKHCPAKPQQIQYHNVLQEHQDIHELRHSTWHIVMQNKDTYTQGHIYHTSMHTCTQARRTLAPTSNMNNNELTPLTLSLACACVLVCSYICFKVLCMCACTCVCLCMLVCLQCDVPSCVP